MVSHDHTYAESEKHSSCASNMHQSRCIVRSSSQEPIIIKSKEGIGQGWPMFMGVNGVALVPLGNMAREAASACLLAVELETEVEDLQAIFVYDY